MVNQWDSIRFEQPLLENITGLFLDSLGWYRLTTDFSHRRGQTGETAGDETGQCRTWRNLTFICSHRHLYLVEYGYISIVLFFEIMEGAGRGNERSDRRLATANKNERRLSTVRMREHVMIHRRHYYYCF